MSVKYHTITDVSTMTGLSTKTLLRWEKSGKLKNIRRNYKGWRVYSIDQINEIRTLLEVAPCENQG